MRFNPDDLPSPLHAEAYKAIVELAGKKKKLDGALADNILESYYLKLAYTRDHRSQGLLSPAENTKIVLKGRNIQIFGGGRGNWKKTKSLSKIEAAETLLAKAREHLDITIAGKSALTELRERRKEVTQKKAVKASKEDLKATALLAALVDESQKLSPLDKLRTLVDDNDFKQEVTAQGERYLGGLKDVDITEIKNKIISDCSINNPPIPLLEKGLNKFEWEEDGFGVTLDRVDQGIAIHIGSATFPIDPFGMRISHRLTSEVGKGYISGAIHLGRGQTPVPTLFLIVSGEKQKGVGTEMVRMFCKLIRAMGFSSFVAQAVGPEGGLFFDKLDSKQLLHTMGKGKSWVIRCGEIIEDPRQLRLFP